MSSLTPQQKIKHLILIKDKELVNDGSTLPPLTASQIELLYDVLVENEEHWDATSELRAGHEETTIPAPGSRHYESQSVAARYIDGSYVGWTYWFGGGKHGNPDEIPWIDDAYDIEIARTETIVRNIYVMKKGV